MIRRFTEVSAPLEERVHGGVVATVWHAVRAGLALQSSVNATINDVELADRTTEAVFGALEPGRLPFCILLAALIAWVARMLALRLQTRRLLETHGNDCQS